MANMPDIKKSQVSMQVSVEDDQRLKKLSRTQKVSKAKIASAILHEGVKNVVLSDEDFKAIARVLESRRESRRKA